MERRTRIVATLGPASVSPDTLDALLRAGLDEWDVATDGSWVTEITGAVVLNRKPGSAPWRVVAEPQDSDM